MDGHHASKRAAQRDLERRMRVAMDKCLGRTEIRARSGVAGKTLGDRMVPAVAELLLTALDREPDVTAHFVSLYANVGVLHNDALPPLSGRDSEQALERIRGILYGLRLPAGPERAAVEAALHAMRFEIRLRPFLWALVGLLRISRGHVEGAGSARRRASALAESTFFTPDPRAGKKTGRNRRAWQARSSGHAIRSMQQELRQMLRAKSLTRRTHATLRAFAVSVGAGGDKSPSSERIALHHVRNAVNHGDVAFTADGATAIGFNGSWRSWIRNSKVRTFKIIPAPMQEANLVNFEGLLCIAHAFEEGARFLLQN